MLPQFTDYLEVFASDERFVVFAGSSLIIALSVVCFLRGSGHATRLLLLSAAFLFVFAFTVLAPLSTLSQLEQASTVSPVTLNYNFGFLALGLGLFAKFRHLPKRSVDTSTQDS